MAHLFQYLYDFRPDSLPFDSNFHGFGPPTCRPSGPWADRSRILQVDHPYDPDCIAGAAFFLCRSLFMAVQFARERFLLPALAPLVYNLGIISGGLILSERVGVEGFSWGALIGAFVGSFFIQGLGALKIGMRLRWQVNLKDPDLKQYALLTIPLIFGLTMMFSTEVFSKFFGSFCRRGAYPGSIMPCASS